MKKLFVFVLTSLCFLACNNTDQASADEKNTEVKPAEMPAAKEMEFDAPIDFELVCVEQKEPSKETGLPYYKLYVKTDLLKESVYVEDLLACTPVKAEEYRSLQMLSNTNSAVNGWYAGGGPLIYGYIEDNNEIVLMRAFQEEGVGHDHAGHDHSGHDHSGHDHSHDDGAHDIDYETFKRIIVHKDGSYEEKSR